METGSTALIADRSVWMILLWAVISCASPRRIRSPGKQSSGLPVRVTRGPVGVACCLGGLWRLARGLSRTQKRREFAAIFDGQIRVGNPERQRGLAPLLEMVPSRESGNWRGGMAKRDRGEDGRPR